MNYANNIAARRKEPDIEYTLLSDGDYGIKQELQAAYEHVLKPCFSTMVKLEPIESFFSLADVEKTSPGAHFHLITAKDKGRIVGTTCFVTYDGENTAYWIYDAVIQRHRGRNIATEMHNRLEAYCAQHFNGKPFTVFAEMPVNDRTNFFERMASTGFREINMPYIDSLGAEGWAPVLKRFGAHGTATPQPSSITKAELMRVLTLNRQLPPNRPLHAEEKDKDVVLVFYRKALARIPGEEVTVFSVPERYRGKRHRTDDKARSCPDLY